MKYHSSFLFYDIYEENNLFFIKLTESHYIGIHSPKEARHYIAFHLPARNKQLQIQLYHFGSN